MFSQNQDIRKSASSAIVSLLFFLIRPGISRIFHLTTPVQPQECPCALKSNPVPYQFILPSGHVLFKIEEATLAHETFTGGMTSEITRVNFERGDGVGVLLYAQDTDEVVLFHYPVYAGGSEPENNAKSWLLEIVAGIKDADGVKSAAGGRGRLRA